MLQLNDVLQDVRGQQDAQTILDALHQLSTGDDDAHRAQPPHKPNAGAVVADGSGRPLAAAVLCVQPKYMVACLPLHTVPHVNQVACPYAEGVVQQLTQVVSRASAAAVAAARSAAHGRYFSESHHAAPLAAVGHAVSVVSAGGAGAAVPVVTALLRDALLHGDHNANTQGGDWTHHGARLSDKNATTATTTLRRRHPPPELGSHPLRVASATTRIGQAARFLAMLGHPLAGFAVTAGAVPAEPALVLRVAYTPFLGYTARQPPPPTSSRSSTAAATTSGPGHSAASKWFSNPCLAQLLLMPLATLHDLGLPTYAASDAVLVIKHLQSSYAAEVFPPAAFPSRAAQWCGFERLLEAVSGGNRDYPRPTRFLLRQLLLMVLLSEVEFENPTDRATGLTTVRHGPDDDSWRGMLCPLSNLSYAMLRVVYALVTRGDAVALDDVAATCQRGSSWDEVTRMTMGEHSKRQAGADEADDNDDAMDDEAPEGPEVIELLSSVLKTAPSPINSRRRIVCGAVDAIFVAVMEMVVSATNQTLGQILNVDEGGGTCGSSGSRVNIVVTCPRVSLPPSSSSSSLLKRRSDGMGSVLPRNLRQGAFSSTQASNLRGGRDAAAKNVAVAQRRARRRGMHIRQLLGNVSADLATALAFRTVAASCRDDDMAEDEGTASLQLLQAMLARPEENDAETLLVPHPRSGTFGRGSNSRDTSSSSLIASSLTQRANDGVLTQLLALQAVAQRERDLPTEIRVSRHYAACEGRLPSPVAESELDSALACTRGSLDRAAGAVGAFSVRLYSTCGESDDSDDDDDGARPLVVAATESTPAVVFWASHAPSRYARLRYDVSDGAPLCPSPLPPTLSADVHHKDHDGALMGGGGGGATSLLDALDVRLKRGLHRHIGVAPTEHEAVRRWKEADAQCRNAFHGKLRACDEKMMADMQGLMRGIVQGAPVVHLHLSVRTEAGAWVDAGDDDSSPTSSADNALTRCYSTLFWCLGGRLVGGVGGDGGTCYDDRDGWQSRRPANFVTQMAAHTLCDRFFPLVAHAPAIAQLRVDRHRSAATIGASPKSIGGGGEMARGAVSDTTFLTAVCEALEFPHHSYRIVLAQNSRDVRSGVEDSGGPRNTPSSGKADDDAAEATFVVYLTALGARHIDRLHDAVEALLAQHCQATLPTTSKEGNVDAEAAPSAINKHPRTAGGGGTVVSSKSGNRRRVASAAAGGISTTTVGRGAANTVLRSEVGAGAGPRLQFTPHKSFVDSGTIRSLQQEGDAEDLLGFRWHQDQAAIAAAAEAAAAAQRLEAARHDATQPPWRREQLRPLEQAVHLTQRFRRDTGAASMGKTDSRQVSNTTTATTPSKRGNGEPLVEEQHGRPHRPSTTTTTPTSKGGTRLGGAAPPASSTAPSAGAVAARGPRHADPTLTQQRRAAATASEAQRLSSRPMQHHGTRQRLLETSVSTIDAIGSNSGASVWSTENLRLGIRGAGRGATADVSRQHRQGRAAGTAPLSPSSAPSQQQQQQQQQQNEPFNAMAFKSMIALGL